MAEKSVKIKNRAMLKSASTRWEMTLEMLLTVENGLADEIVLEIPSDLTTGFTLEPRMDYNLETISSLENMEEETEEETEEKTEKEAEKEKPARKTEKDTEETPLKKFTQETLGGEWSRMIIRPKTPFSGTVVLRLNTELQDNRLDSSTRTALVRLPIVRFPGVTVKGHDIILPELTTEEMRTRYRWVIEGMLPVQASRFELPENKPMMISEENITESLPILPEWRAGNGIRVCHIFDRRYTAQLLARSRNMTNPTVESAIYSAYWNPEKELLGIGVFDVYPQKSPTCVLRIPREMKILEMHLDSRPVQVEEVSWNQKNGEFLPITDDAETQNEYRFYRITLRSLQLPQRLEVLFHCEIPDWRGNRRLTLSPPFQTLDRLYHLEFPVMIRQLDGAYTPIKARNGAAFFYTGTDMPMSFWTKMENRSTGSEHGNGNGNGNTLLNGNRNESGNMLLNGNGEISENSIGNSLRNHAGNSTRNGEKVVRETESNLTENRNGTVTFSGNGNQESMKNQNSQKMQKTAKNGITDFPGYENSHDFKAVTVRSWCRIQLVCLERFLALTAQVSTFQPTGQASREELHHWFETWNVLRFGNERLVQLSLDSGTETDTKNRAELTQNFEQLKADGTRIFARQLGENATRPAVIRARMEQLRQNSLWLVFLRNISHDCADCRVAFETDGAYDFYITETHSERFCRLPYLWQAVFTLFFTLMIALGVRFHPSIPEEVRTLPFWLLCVGTLCVLCGVNYWLSATFLVVAVVSLIYRLGKLARD
ncbi:MAG: hypothetical protein Q4C70_15400 [Planctomycetia bacterium]|nr:hypothetical protein [Planctomycetia bacterium]